MPKPFRLFKLRAGPLGWITLIRPSRYSRMSSITIRLTTLMVKQVTRPIVSLFRVQAEKYPKFKRSCIRFAQRLYRIDTMLEMAMKGQPITSGSIKPLNDFTALENFSGFITEILIFGVAGFLISYETVKSKTNESIKREMLEGDIITLQDEINWLRKKLEDEHIIQEEYTPPIVKRGVLDQFDVKS